MSNRKLYINIMDRLLNAYNNKNDNKGLISEDEYPTINEMISLGYLNKNAFAKLESGNAGIICMDYIGDYPLTAKGKEYYEMDWYEVLKQSGAYQIIRDVSAFVGAAAGIVIAALELFKK